MKTSRILLSIFVIGSILTIPGYSVPNKFPNEPHPNKPHPTAPIPKPQETGPKTNKLAAIFLMANEAGSLGSPWPLPPSPYVDSSAKEGKENVGETPARKSQPAEGEHEFRSANPGRQSTNRS